MPLTSRRPSAIALVAALRLERQIPNTMSTTKRLFIFHLAFEWIGNHQHAVGGGVRGPAGHECQPFTGARSQPRCGIRSVSFPGWDCEDVIDLIAVEIAS